MSAPAAVIGRLEAVSAVTALVSTRIYQGLLPQSPTLPAIRVQRIGEDEFMHLRGASVRRTRVQVDAVASSLPSALAVDAAVRGDASSSSLVGWMGSIGSVRVLAVEPAALRELYDGDELRQHRVSRDVFVWWSA